MPVHKIIKGEGGEQYLPFALSRLRHFSVAGLGNTSQKYTFENGSVTVRVEYNPDHGNHFIRIDGGGVQGYEFVTTGAELSFEGLPIVEKYVTTVNVSRQKGKALFSNVAKEGGIATATERAHVPEGINRQANSEYFWWPIDATKPIQGQVRTGNYFMTSTFGRKMGEVQFYDDQFMFDYDWSAFIRDDKIVYDRLGANTDLMYDVLPTIHGDGTPAVSAAPYADEPNWWRRAAVQVKGGRSFVIMTDMQSNVLVVPASYLTSPVAALFPKDKGVLILAGAFLPAGVAVPTMASMVRPSRVVSRQAVGLSLNDSAVFVDNTPAGDARYEYDGYPVERGAYPGPVDGFDPDKQYQKHDYVWAFNSTGTRMVSVVHADKNNGHPDLTVLDITVEDKQFGTWPARSPWRRIAQCGANMHVPALTQTAYAGWLAQFDGVKGVEIFTRALVELEINITVTGEKEDDFTATVTPVRFVKDRWFTGADYAYRDERLVAKGVELDDLITSELTLYTGQDEHTGLGYRRYNVGNLPLTPALPTRQYSEIVTHAFRKVSNLTRASTLFHFCVVADGSMGIEGRYVMASAQLTGLFPGHELHRFGPFGTYDIYDPAWPDTAPYLFWAYRSVQKPVSVATEKFTGLDIEDLRSLSFVFTGSSDDQAGASVGIYKVVFGEKKQADANVAGIIERNITGVLTTNKLIPAKFNVPIEHAVDFSGFVPLAPSDVSTAFGLGLHRAIQGKTTHHGQSATTESGKYASHPDGHFAHVTVSAVASGAVKMYDDIQYRKSTKNEDGTYTQKIETATHMGAYQKLWGDRYTPANFMTNFYDGVSDNAANTPVLCRVGYWWNIKLTPHKRTGVTGFNPRFET